MSDVEQLTSELELSEDKVVSLERQIKELKDKMLVLKEKHREDIHRLEKQFRGNKVKASALSDSWMVSQDTLRYAQDLAAAQQQQGAQAGINIVEYTGGALYTGEIMVDNFGMTDGTAAITTTNTGVYIPTGDGT